MKIQKQAQVVVPMEVQMKTHKVKIVVIQVIARKVYLKQIQLQLIQIFLILKKRNNELVQSKNYQNRPLLNAYSVEASEIKSKLISSQNSANYNNNAEIAFK